MSQSHVTEFFNHKTSVAASKLCTSILKAESSYGCPLQDFTQEQMEAFAAESLAYDLMMSKDGAASDSFRTFSLRFRMILEYLDWLYDNGYITLQINQLHPARILYKNTQEARFDAVKKSKTYKPYQDQNDLRSVMFFSLQEYKDYCSALFPDEDTFIHLRAPMDMCWLGFTPTQIINMKRTAFHDGDVGEAYIEWDGTMAVIQDRDFLRNIRHLVKDDEVLILVDSDRYAKPRYNSYKWIESDYLVRTAYIGRKPKDSKTRDLQYLNHLSVVLKRHQDHLDSDSPWRNKKISCNSLRLSGKFCSIREQDLSLQQAMGQAKQFLATCDTLFKSVNYSNWLEIAEETAR